MAGYDNTVANQKVFKPLAARNAWDENKHFEIDTKRVWDKKKKLTKQSSLSSKFRAAIKTEKK